MDVVWWSYNWTIYEHYSKLQPCFLKQGKCCKINICGVGGKKACSSSKSVCGHFSPNVWQMESSASLLVACIQKQVYLGHAVSVTIYILTVALEICITECELFSDVCVLEDDCSVPLRNLGNRLVNDPASYPRKKRASLMLIPWRILCTHCIKWTHDIEVTCICM
jgi:hypothetical protein